MDTDTTDRVDSTDVPATDTGVGPPVYDEVVVRRNGLLSGALAAICALVAAAFLSRGVADSSWVWWAIGLAFFAITWGYVFTLLDSRTPLMVADEYGVRLRLGRTWRGMAWHQLEEVEHQPRRWLRDGRLVLFPIDEQAELEMLGRAGRRHASANEMMYHAAFTMPLAMTTRVFGAAGDLTGSLAGLAAGRCPIVQIQSSDTVEVVEPADPAADLDAPDDVFDQLADDAPQVAVAALETAPIAVVSSIPMPSLTPSPTPSPARDPRVAVRADITSAMEDPDVTQLYDREQLAALDDTGVWRSATVVIDDVAERPIVEPVIGPVLASARRMLHLDIDELAGRTRIRPHVIEAIEIDDFAVCGGDFYARGHLRTLARVLGVDAGPLLATYTERYADAPIDPKRVFEAELAGAGRGPIRSTRGGPNWTVLVAAVMTLVLAWSVARLVTDHPASHAGSPSLANGSAGLTSSQTKVNPVPVTLTAAGGGAHLVVRDGTGKVVFTGDLAFGQSRTLQVPPPVRVQSTDGSTRVAIEGKDQGKLGKTGQPAEHVYPAP